MCMSLDRHERYLRLRIYYVRGIGRDQPVRYRNELYRFAMPCPASSLNIYTFIIAERGELAFVTSARVGDVQRGKIELSDRIDLIAITTFCYGSNLPGIIFPDDTQRGTSTSWHGNCYGKLNRIFPGHLNFSPEDVFQVLTEWWWNWNLIKTVWRLWFIFKIYVIWMIVIRVV